MADYIPGPDAQRESITRSAFSIIAIITMFLATVTPGYAIIPSFQGLGDLPGGAFSPGAECPLMPSPMVTAAKPKLEP